MCQPYIESATALPDTLTPTRLHYPARLRARVKRETNEKDRERRP